ncbi:hypothetical protein HELRODRAFT_189102 [Helobdella robusta]|uniref:IQ motif and ubiquitin-like domain-containing protein n=1 Tax=Helobdella robusta TaxID=6412 RepID=T1FQN4_HELRO|nr:hypothetical protein HELRODRAFT_189102 [Helobdella robusta]ESN96088.1 hypothetical protein HELRODRAFT_189102 [Helobdella robusta]
MSDNEKEGDTDFHGPVVIDSVIEMKDIDPSLINFLPSETTFSQLSRLQVPGGHQHPLSGLYATCSAAVANVSNLEADLPDKYTKPSKFEKLSPLIKKKAPTLKHYSDDILAKYKKQIQKLSSSPTPPAAKLSVKPSPKFSFEVELIPSLLSDDENSSSDEDEIEKGSPIGQADFLDILGQVKPDDVKNCEPTIPYDIEDRADSSARLFHSSELRYYQRKLRWRQNLMIEKLLEKERLMKLAEEEERKKFMDLNATLNKEQPNLKYEDDLMMEDDDDYINVCTDMQVLLLKDGVSDPKNFEYKFKCHQDERLIDFKMKLTSVMNCSFHLITIQNLEGKVLEDSMPFTCWLSSKDRTEPGLLKLMIRDQPAENGDSSWTQYNVLLVPIVLPKVYLIKLKSGEEITVEKEQGRKAFLGGYVDNVNCKVYHNSATQTTNRKDICEIYERLENLNRREKYSQTQSSRTVAKKLCIEYEETQLLDFSFLEAEKAEQMYRRMHPKTKEDFDLLYVDLEGQFIWRLAELADISSRMTGAKKKATLCQLMEDESRLIKCICEMQRSIKDQRLLQIFQNYINRISKPQMKRDERGLPLSVDTWYKIQSRLLFVQYQTMDHNTTFMSGPYERLSALNNLKKYLEGNDNDRLINVKLEILEMIEREATLTMRGVRKDRLLGLRKRINSLFYTLLKKPEFNPAVVEHLKNLRDPSYLATIVCCISCEKNLPVCMYPHTTSFTTLPNICKDCQRTNNRGCKRTDVSLYAAMLMRLRKNERDYDDGSRVAFFIQTRDIQYLVDCIWQMRSILSKNTNLNSLVLMRWDIKKEWTPWNSILVTMHEALCHLRVNDTYSPELIYFVRHKHVQAYKEFSRLVPLTCRRQLPLHKKLTNLPEVRECPPGVPKVYSVKKPHEKRSVHCKNLRML